MNFSDIESRTLHLQEEIWARRAELWHDGEAKTRFDILQASAAARVFGYTYQELGTLGGTEQSTVAGLLSIEKRRITVVTSFHPRIVRFTAGHELGHVALNHGIEGLHRDRPVEGVSLGVRRPREREADQFSALFYMPRFLVEEEFERRFGPKPFQLTETTAYHLNPAKMHAMLTGSESHACGLAVARCERWSTRRFTSLADRFGVSPLSMAIQLEEFGLVPT